MTSLVITENRHSGGYLVSEANAERARDQITVLQQTYGAGVYVTQAGTILGEILAGTSAAYAATGGNTGNFTCSAVVLEAGLVEGAYNVEFIAPTVFNVHNPNGDFVGEGDTGVLFNQGGLHFTITAGGAAAVAGDSATITVAANANVGLYNALSLTATDGTAVAAGILYNTMDLSQGNTLATINSRACEVNGSELIYPTAATANQIAAINAQLKSLGIIVR